MAKGMGIHHAKPGPNDHACSTSFDTLPREILFHIFTLLLNSTTGRTAENNVKITNDLFNLRLVNHETKAVSTAILRSITEKPEFAHYRKIIFPKHPLSLLVDVLAVDWSSLKGFATSLEIHSYRTLPSTLSLQEYSERIENFMLPSDYQGLDMQELYNANRHHEIFQQRFLHRLSPAHQRRFFNSLLRCLPASFPIKMTQRPLSDFMADRFEDASPFTIDTWVEDLSPNTDMVLFAALVSRLPYSRISLIDMELYGDTPELLMVDIGLRFLTIAANDLEQLMFLKYWASFLRQVPRLEHLRIQDRTTEGWSHNGIDAMINGVHLPCLSVLVIEDIHFGFEQLFTFLAAHTSSLTQVKLLGYCMDEGQHLQSFLFAARGRAWTRQFKWTITEKHNSRWEAGFLRAFEAYIFTNVDVPGHPRDVGRFFM